MSFFPRNRKDNMINLREYKQGSKRRTELINQKTNNRYNKTSFKLDQGGKKEKHNHEYVST